MFKGCYCPDTIVICLGNKSGKFPVLLLRTRVVAAAAVAATATMCDLVLT